MEAALFALVSEQPVADPRAGMAPSADGVSVEVGARASPLEWVVHTGCVNVIMAQEGHAAVICVEWH